MFAQNVQIFVINVTISLDSVVSVSGTLSPQRKIRGNVCVQKASGNLRMVHAISALVTVKHATTTQGFVVNATRNHSHSTQEFVIVLPTLSLLIKRQVYVRF
jgi:hypothetical protein